MKINGINNQIINNQIKHISTNNSFDSILNNEIQSLNKENTNTIDEKLLKEQTDAFESFMLKMVLDISIKVENPLYGKDAADDIYKSMYNDAISNALSGNIGYSELLFNFLKERI